ncbi:MFS transporter permease [Microbacterium sp.]|uniref:MFS transporter permease n=1 Tax=Microbacterium sp. TaxID=51671 RepID=UPI0025F2A349|nr:MFS transporter permease [Microbacterium sp.]
MWLRRAFFQWLIPAAFVLPLWLLIGWIVFGASPWALLWVFVSVPVVFIGQLTLSLLVRARGTVRISRSVSWIDVALFGAWHVLIVALGVFSNPWWWPVLGVTVAVGVALLWTQLWELWREAKPMVAMRRTADGVAYIPAPRFETTRGAAPGVVVVSERPGPPPA